MSTDVTTTKAYTSADSFVHVEGSYGVTSAALQATLVHSIDRTEAAFVATKKEWVDNAQQLNRRRGATKARVSKKEGGVSVKHFFSARALMKYLAPAMQRITSGAASSAANETFTFTAGAATAGAGTFTFMGFTTDPLAYNASAAARQAALEALPTIGAGNILVTLSSGTYTHTFQNDLAGLPLPPVTHTTTAAYTGGAPVLTYTQQGSTAGLRAHTVLFPDVCIAQQPGYEFVESLACDGAPETRILYKGCVVSKITIEVSGLGYVNLTIEVITDGTETVLETFTLPTDSADTVDFFTNQVWVAFGDDTSDLLGEDELASMTITLDFGMTVKDRIKRGGKTQVTLVRYGDVIVTIEMTVLGDKAHRFHNRFHSQEAGDRTFLNIRFDPESEIGEPEPQETVDMTFSVCLIKECTLEPDGEEPQLKLSIMPMDNPTDDGFGVIVCKTPETAYLIVPS